MSPLQRSPRGKAQPHSTGSFHPLGFLEKNKPKEKDKAAWEKDTS